MLLLEISSLKLAPVASQVGLCLTRSKPLKTSFIMTGLILYVNKNKSAYRAVLISTLFAALKVSKGKLYIFREID